MPEVALIKYSRLFLIAASLLGVLALDIFFIEPYWIQIHKVVIHDPALAPAVGNLKIVQITDIHMTQGLGIRERQLIKKVNALKPDIIFMTGDIVDDLSQIPAAVELLKSLKANIGIYGVQGNTDHIVMDSQSFVREFSPTGMDILVNESRKIRLSNGYFLWLIGVDDPKYHHSNLDAAAAGIPVDAPTILLAHSPEIFEAAARAKINLVLAGDTHGGQVGIDFLIRMSEYANRTPYMRGLFQTGKTKMYVNRGIGTKTLPIRFLCRPEIALIEVVP